MNKNSLLFLLLIASSPIVSAACNTPACRDAAELYTADRKLCAEEATSGARLQCLRDAKAEYNRAMAQASQPSAERTPTFTGTTRPQSGCPDCGKVSSVQIIEKKGEGGALGMIGGGIAGALLGNQIGKGSGNKVATVAGAAGGAYAGKKIEEQVRTTRVWSVRVRLDTGEERTFQFEQDPGLMAGDLVRLAGNSVVRR
ncbi:MAG TPA: glycine zipper 2TM domain-containing protein [Rhodocyclaceae bacterium]|nr:glycine zipper 2TM domain-containing protein [Rhodocyclaceae bacterium]